MSLRVGVYRHYKGQEYRLIGVARHTETEEELVFYTPLYNDSGLWVRPLTMFIELIERDGESVPRFGFVREK